MGAEQLLFATVSYQATIRAYNPDETHLFSVIYRVTSFGRIGSGPTLYILNVFFCGRFVTVFLFLLTAAWVVPG